MLAENEWIAEIEAYGSVIPTYWWFSIECIPLDLLSSNQERKERSAKRGEKLGETILVEGKDSYHKGAPWGCRGSSPKLDVVQQKEGEK